MKRSSRRTVTSLALVVAFALAGCGDDLPTDPLPPAEPEPIELAGLWDFTETLIVSRLVVVCRDTGSFSFTQDDTSFTGRAGLIGTCTGLLGSFRNSASLAIDSGIVTDSLISFTLDHGCRYIGTVHSGPPRRIVGSSACSINFDGTWEAVEGGAVRSVTVEPDSLAMVVGETVQLTAVLKEVSGARIFERPVTWASSEPGTFEVSDSGRVVSAGAGSGQVTATAAGLVGVSDLSSDFVSFESIDAGIFHTCGVSAEQWAYCWGRNNRGQAGATLGTVECEGDLPCRTAPGSVSTGVEFSMVSTGFDSSCGVTAGGGAFCWGGNGVGQLGNGSMIGSAQPVAVSGGVTYTSVSVGSEHACGLSSNGDVYCWGNNFAGQLGTGVAEPSLVPAPVSGNQTFVSVTSGGNHTCGLREDGAVSCWGDNFGGQLGIDISTRESLEPVESVPGFTFSTISAGGLHVCGISTQGEAYCWGENTDRQLGVDSLEFTWNPRRPSGGLGFISVTSGGFHTCGLTPDGSAYCWGRGSSGQLGTGSETNDMATPQAVVGGHQFQRLSAGAFYTCGITVAGRVFCWGSNTDGQLGAGLVSTTPEPVRVIGQP